MKLITYGPDVPLWAVQTFERFTRMLNDRLVAPLLLWMPATAAQLPAASAANKGSIAYEADRGLVVSNGSTWGSAGGVNLGRGVVDFGAGASDASVSISAPGVGASSAVQASILAIASADHTADEHRVEEIDVCAGAVQAGVGFSVFAKARNFPLFGKYNVAWEWA